jgi:hypothetical protein
MLVALALLSACPAAEEEKPPPPPTVAVWREVTEWDKASGKRQVIDKGWNVVVVGTPFLCQLGKEIYRTGKGWPPPKPVLFLGYQARLAVTACDGCKFRLEGEVTSTFVEPEGEMKWVRSAKATPTLEGVPGKPYRFEVPKESGKVYIFELTVQPPAP